MEQPRAGQSPERLGFLTDAVLAIAMTLLVIEIPRPEGKDFDIGPGISAAQAASQLWKFLVHEAGAFYSYALAFLMLWIVWRQHHTVLDRLRYIPGLTMALHFPLLLLAGFLPFATAIMGHHPGNPLATVLFGAVVFLLMLCRSGVQSAAARTDALPDDTSAQRIERTACWVVTCYWGLTLLIAWWTPWVQILWFLSGAVGHAFARLALLRETKAAGAS
ncbi:TMEM175 family protein [Streptomyces sp. NRRL F-2747]|uniref:TMEM175 family protein n=1 Tax=Streptomyces sp. NRRL F-2747 TaxID=1463843 RepID=UPI000A871F66|nr:TMEM175 family protein [Streptomyces sp. NRRL F-2747]